MRICCSSTSPTPRTTGEWRLIVFVLCCQNSLAKEENKWVIFIRSNILTLYYLSCRRFFYILSTVSFVGSVDLCLTVFSSRTDAQQPGGHSSTYNRALTALRLKYDTSALILTLLIALAYGVAFVMTLLMSAFDVLTTVRDGYRGADWVDYALLDSQYT
jgi:hypothetical protein